MFDIDSSELAVIAIVALIVIGPKDLPRVMRLVGQWVAKARGMARHVRTGFDAMVREAEIDEMNKRWETENRAIMAATTGQHFADPIAAAAPSAADLGFAESVAAEAAAVQPEAIQHSEPTTRPAE